MATTTNTEYLIEQIERDILIRQSDKCYTWMFRHKGSHWCFALQIKTMYLMTIDQVKERLKLHKK
jgi:hypothetical protein